MSTQRKLNALLFELQTARSPLHQAKTLARAWRTVRELSPTDRRLLARHVGFDGAEQLLEGLATTRGGLAPAVLLKALAAARNSDGAAVSEAVADLQRPDDRPRALSRSLDFASGLLDTTDGDGDSHDEARQASDDDEIGGALGELQAVHPIEEDSRENASAAVSTLDHGAWPRRQNGSAGEGSAEDGAPAAATENGRLPAKETGDDADDGDNQTGQPEDGETQVRTVAPEIPPVSLPPAVRAGVVDWSRWEPAQDKRRPGPEPRFDRSVPKVDEGPPPFDARAVLGALGAQASIISQLRVLRRERAGFAGSSVDTLRQVVEAFPDGWARRRALSALLEAGIPPRADDAIELVSMLDSESDRRWCLGILARTGALWGSNLERALVLLESPAARRRVETAARG